MGVVGIQLVLCLPVMLRRRRCVLITTTTTTTAAAAAAEPVGLCHGRHRHERVGVQRVHVVVNIRFEALLTHVGRWGRWVALGCGGSGAVVVGE